MKAGWFIQDDFRPSRTLQLSLGLRQEVQTQVDSKWNFAPRAAFTWNATRTTTIRGGYGIFYDWYDAGVYEQTIRVDGESPGRRDRAESVVPGASKAAARRLPASVIRAGTLGQPIIHQASIGFEKPLTPWADFRTDYMWTRGYNTLRSVNVNAPVNGVRPDAAFGNITEIQSSGKRATDRFTVALNARYMPRRILGMVMYQLASARNFADTATMLPSDSTNPDADWGPSAQDVRHRIFFNFNTPLARGVRMGLNVQGASAVPYNIITGFDTNGDSVFNDRDGRRDAQQRPRRDAVDREHAPQQVDRPRRRALRSAEHAAAPAATAHRRRDGAAGGWRRRSRRRRRPADGGDGRRQYQIPPGPVPERAERVQQDELQRVCRQPAVVVLRHGHVGRSGASSRDRRFSELLTDSCRGGRAVGTIASERPLPAMFPAECLPVNILPGKYCSRVS